MCLACCLLLIVVGSVESLFLSRNGCTVAVYVLYVSIIQTTTLRHMDGISRPELNCGRWTSEMMLFFFCFTPADRDGLEVL